MQKLSVILCTHNPREDYLRRVLEGLRGQTLAMTEWEFLLVDNGSSSPLAAQVDLSWHPHARHVREEELGLTPARRRGISESKAELLVFVDDDTVLAADYLEQALMISEQWPFIGTWGGSYRPEYEIPLPDWVGDQVWRLTVVEVKQDVWSNLRNMSTIPAGAGLCCRRRVCEDYLERLRLNSNRLTLGRKGKDLAGYEDVDISYCALDLGLGTGKSTRLSLTHLIPAARLTLDYFVRHAEGDATSYVMFLAMRGTPVKKGKPLSWLGFLRRYLHRVKDRIPREQIEIETAHNRGWQKGCLLAKKYLEEVKG